MPVPVYDIAMLAPPGVGKTSLLSAIHSQLMTGIPGTDLQVRSVPSSASWLQERRAELERICRNARVTEPGIPGTGTVKTIEMTLGRTDQPDGDGHLTLRFSDHPGKWMFSDVSEPSSSQRELLDRFDSAQVLILVIDAAGLLWHNGDHHHDVNRPQQAAERIRDWVNTGDRRLAILAPVKCERWLPLPDPDLEEMRAAVEHGYKEALTFLAEGGVLTHLAPVRTVGGLVHDGYRVGRDGKLKSRYRGATAIPQYRPDWGAEVLRLLLIQAIERREAERGFWESVATFFGHHKDIRRGIEEMGKQSYGPSLRLRP